MAAYKIIGDDEKEYGPVSAEQIREWISQGRVEGQTRVLVEGGGEWQRVEEVAELSTGLLQDRPNRCPSCGEAFEAGFDSCWKCGTAKEGSPPKRKEPFAAGTPGEPAAPGNQSPDAPEDDLTPACPRCKSHRLVGGRFTASQGSPVFRPKAMRSFTLTLFGGVEIWNDQVWACLDCGCLWSEINTTDLKTFIRRHCTEETIGECGLSEESD